MKWFYDCEFHEDGKTIDFISIGMVSEWGDEYYAVSNEFDTRRVAQNNWLMDNVMSSIEHQQFLVFDGFGQPAVRDIYVTDPAAKSRDEIAQDIVHLLSQSRSESELWAWYCAYDHVCLAQLFGRMIDLPESVPMFTNDLKTLVKEAEKKLGGQLHLPKQPDGLHNALEDARHNVVRYNYLREILDNV